jgi:hypothetical protein
MLTGTETQTVRDSETYMNIDGATDRDIDTEKT